MKYFLSDYVCIFFSALANATVVGGLIFFFFLNNSTKIFSRQWGTYLCDGVNSIYFGECFYHKSEVILLCFMSADITEDKHCQILIVLILIIKIKIIKEL
jgi:hypothetical protein